MGSPPKSVIAAIALGTVVAGTGGAVADRLVTGADVKDGSLQLRDLSPGVRARLQAAAGSGSTSMHYTGFFPDRSLSLPGGRKLTTSCSGSGGAGGGSTQLYLVLSSAPSAARSTVLNGRLDTTGASETDPGQVGMVFDDQLFQAGEHYVAFRGKGRLEMLLKSGWSSASPGGPTSTPPNAANVSLVAHWGQTAETIDVQMYITRGGCEIAVQAVHSRDHAG